MISILLVIMIACIHWEADFSLQTHEMATNKSKSNYWLTMHVLVYTSATLLFWRFFIFDVDTVYHFTDYLYFSIFIFVTHWITDYITSRFTGKLYKEGKYHEFFCVIGVDQVLHLTQLLIAYHLFK